MISEGNLVGPSNFSLFTSRITCDGFKFEPTRALVYGYPAFEMGELPRKFFSFHCLEIESNELRESDTERAENYPDLPQRSESDVECSGGGDVSPEKKLVDWEVIPVCEVHLESTEGVIVLDLPNVVESVQGDSRDESHIIVSHLLGENIYVLDDSRLRQLVENSPVEFGTVLEEVRSAADVRGVSSGQFTENVNSLDNVVDLESGNWTSTPSKNAVNVSGKRKAKRSEAAAECVLRPKIVAFESGYGSDEEIVGVQSEIGRVDAGKSYLSSECADKTCTVFGLSELEMMARAKAQELGPDSHVVSSDGMVRVTTVGSSGGPSDVDAV